MKRDRNTFFQNYNAQTQSYIPTPNMTMPTMPNMSQMTQTGQFGPYQAAKEESSFYAGPNIQSNSEFEQRISKIERQINRLDQRISKLENSTKLEIDENNYSNMYML